MIKYLSENDQSLNQWDFYQLKSMFLSHVQQPTSSEGYKPQSYFDASLPAFNKTSFLHTVPVCLSEFFLLSDKNQG